MKVVSISEEKGEEAAVRYISSPSLCYNKVCGAERARSAPPAALPGGGRGWLIALHQSLSSLAVIDCGRIEEKSRRGNTGVLKGNKKSHDHAQWLASTRLLKTCQVILQVKPRSNSR